MTQEFHQKFYNLTAFWYGSVGKICAAFTCPTQQHHNADSLQSSSFDVSLGSTHTPETLLTLSKTQVEASIRR
jgi:hypothetical protein